MVERMARAYCELNPELGAIVTRGGREGILLTDSDASNPSGDFIPFKYLGYNVQMGFFDKRLFPEERSE